MPVVLRVGPYRFVVYSNEPDEPAHVHVKRDRARAKLWLAPVRYAHAKGFSDHELTKIAHIASANETALLHAWKHRNRPD